MMTFDKCTEFLTIINLHMPVQNLSARTDTRDELWVSNSEKNECVKCTTIFVRTGG
jgi:hypothetical protein